MRTDKSATEEANNIESEGLKVKEYYDRELVKEPFFFDIRFY
jgi:hypothetical protein